MPSGSSSHPFVIYGAIAANVVIACAKFVAAYVTGSAAMLSEGVHSLVDTGNQGLLLFGIHRSKLPADQNHPFGHGRELYFWGLVVALILFGGGGGVAIYEGVLHVLHPMPLGDPTWAYAVLTVGVLAEGTSWTIAFREFRRTMGPIPLWEALQESKDPTVVTVLLEDTAALAGLVLAFAGILLAHSLHDPRLDGAASILIGLVLVVAATFLARDARGLIVGETASATSVRRIRAAAAAEMAVRDVLRVLTMHLGPHEVLVAMDVTFRPELSAEGVAEAVARMERSVRAASADVTQVFIEARAVGEHCSDHHAAAVGAVTIDG
jgi:cation diffusion facilitator family transporter